MISNDKNLPATKGDLEKFATKNDLEKMEASFIEKFATKDDLKEQEQKLNNKIETVYHEVVKLQSKVGNIEEKMATKDDINRIMNAIDTFAGEAKDYRRKDADRGHTLMEHHDKLEDYESRVTALEAKK